MKGNVLIYESNNLEVINIVFRALVASGHIKGNEPKSVSHHRFIAYCITMNDKGEVHTEYRFKEENSKIISHEEFLKENNFTADDIPF